MAIEHIQLSQQAKEQLIRLKGLTGLESWNVLCRWGLCVSLAEPTVPPARRIPADSNVEMSWRVFAGNYGDLYLTLLKERCVRDGLGADDETVAQQFRLHLHRGISYLVADKKLRGIEDLVSLGCSAQSTDEASGANALGEE